MNFVNFSITETFLQLFRSEKASMSLLEDYR